jgi:ribosomal protein S6--L-glutamate ligase
MGETLRAEGIDSFVFSLGDSLHDLQSGTVTLDGRDLSALDGIVVKKLGSQSDPALRLRLHALRQLEYRGVRIFSRPAIIDVVMDRYRMSMKLIEAGFPMPRTFSFESERALIEAVQVLGQGVVKPAYTSKARGMVRIDAETARATVPAGDPPSGRTLVQQYVDAPGRDIGACVLGGRYVGAFYRVSAPGQWVTSTSAGGSYAACRLPEGAIDLAERAADLFGLDYTIVDLVETESGYLIYEVSAFGGFRGLLEAEQQDVAAAYARYVKADLRG